MNDNNIDNHDLIDAERAANPRPLDSSAPRQSMLKNVWNALRPSRAVVMGAGAVVLTGAVTIHFFNNEEKVISTALQDTPITFYPVNDNTTLIQQGSNLAVRYGSVVCPIAMGWPENTSIVLGNKGDATITPTDENPLTTILGTLGVARDVTIKHELHPDAKNLMSDFYRHSENCMDKIIGLQKAEDREPSAAEPTF